MPMIGQSTLSRVTASGVGRSWLSDVTPGTDTSLSPLLWFLLLPSLRDSKYDRTGGPRPGPGL